LPAQFTLETEIWMRHIVVRDSIETDMKAVQRIYAHYVLCGLGSFEEVPPSLVELKRRRKQALALRFPFLIAEIDDAVVGYSDATLFRERSAYRYTIEDSIDVDPRMTRRGAGRMIGTLHSVGFKLGRWVDAVLMQRALGACWQIDDHYL
jgi:L-amino acid N-acyltransferase YncA